MDFSAAYFSPTFFSPRDFSPTDFFRHSRLIFFTHTLFTHIFHPGTLHPETLLPQTFHPQTFHPQTFHPQSFRPQTFTDPYAHIFIFSSPLAKVSQFHTLYRQKFLLHHSDCASIHGPLPLPSSPHIFVTHFQSFLISPKKMQKALTEPAQQSHLLLC